MSSVASSSVGNMPPRHGKKLSDTMDDSFNSNSKANTNAQTPESDPRPQTPAAPHNVEAAPALAKVPVARKIQGYTRRSTHRNPASVVFAPRRHVAASKALGANIASPCTRNVPTARARLADGTLVRFLVPLSSSHEANLSPLTTVAAVHPDSVPRSVDNNAGPSVEPARAKRKTAPKAKRPDAVEVGDAETEDGPALKKRRVTSDPRAHSLKDIEELEGAIKKLQSSVNKDLKNLAQLAATLSAQLHDMPGN
ncbi:hypothetical protein C0991_006710 [Blastosporella zonata]|nr:hypothetical protein C0991_006710 [Blastosporella zonata]